MVCLAVPLTAKVNLLLLRRVAQSVGRLAGTVRLIGEGRLGLQKDGFATAELATLAGAIDSMSRALAEAEREREAQLAKARRVQEHLLACRVGRSGSDDVTLVALERSGGLPPDKEEMVP